MILLLICKVSQILSAWLLADLLTGFVHWFEDLYMHKHTTDWLNSIANDNDLHHRKPTAMLTSSGWVNMRSGAVFGWPMAALFLILGMPLFVWLTPFFAGFGNLVHRWAHQPRRKLVWPIRAMQWTGLFISPGHHDSHHRSMNQLVPKHLSGYRFCGMTTWVNPILDLVGFWKLPQFGLRLVGMRTTKERLAA